MAFETKYGLNIAPSGLGGTAATAYVLAVRKHLMWIDGTKVGRFLLQAIGWHARHNPGNLTGGVMTIQPYTGGKCNAAADNTVRTPTGWSQPAVSYSPDVFTHGGACQEQMKKATTNRGLYPDELLFHELVHGFRGASARFSANRLHGGLAGYTGSEEFVAVLLTNIYISDPSNGSKTGLRADHDGFRPLDPYFSDSFRFFRSSSNAFALVDQLCTENPSLTKWISGVKAPFNPLTAYYADKAKARAMSNGAVSMVRDRDWQGLIAGLLSGTLTK